MKLRHAANPVSRLRAESWVLLRSADKGSVPSSSRSMAVAVRDASAVEDSALYLESIPVSVATLL
jgi:hypothetical protein